MKKNDIILLCATLLVCALTLGAAYLILGDGGTLVVVEVDGKEYARLPLDEDRELLIESENGTNLLIVKDGKAYIAEASCPDGICVRTGAADELRSIVCLPNRVVVRLEGGD